MFSEFEGDDDAIRNELSFLLESVREFAPTSESEVVPLIDKVGGGNIPPLEIEKIRHRLRAIWRTHRLGIGVDEWQAPSINSSLSLREAGREQRSIVMKYDDAYLRWTGAPDLSVWEQSFIQQIVCRKDRTFLKPIALSTNTGIGALILAVEWIQHGLDKPNTVIVHPRSYFEIKRVFPGSYLHDWTEPYLSSLRNAVIVIEPINNSLWRDVNCISEIVKIIGPLKDKNVFMVIDRSAHGGFLDLRSCSLSDDDLQNVLFIESLLKTSQYGLDIVQSGIIICFVLPDEYENAIRDFCLFRGIRGRTPADVQSLLFLPIQGDLIDARWERHRRNAKIIATTLNERIGVQEHISLHYPKISGAYGSALLSLCPYHIVDPIALDSITNRILNLASARGILLNEGFGFAFNVSRIAHIIENYGKRDEIPYIRVAAGAEDVQTARGVGDLITMALVASN